MHPAKGVKPKMRQHKLTSWCKLARGGKATGVKQKAGILLQSDKSLNFPYYKAVDQLGFFKFRQLM